MPGNKVSHRQGQRSSRSQFSLGIVKNKMSGFFLSESKGSSSKSRKRQAKSSQARLILLLQSTFK